MAFTQRVGQGQDSSFENFPQKKTKPAKQNQIGGVKTFPFFGIRFFGRVFIKNIQEIEQKNILWQNCNADGKHHTLMAIHDSL